MEIQKILALADRAYKINATNGFHKAEDEPQFMEYKYLMLVITEIAEAVEADRKGNRADRDAFETRTNVHPEFVERFEAYIKDSLEDEFADVFIRLVDMVEVFNLDVAPFISQRKIVTDTVWNEFKDSTFVEKSYILVRLLTHHQYTLEQMVGFAIVYVELFAEQLGIDLEWHVERKLDYNETRGLKHGKSY